MLKLNALFSGATAGLLAALLGTPSVAINAVNPTGVVVRSNAPNTVFITFQGLEPNERAVEALWCGTVQPGIGAGSVSSSDPCVPGTLFGRLPLNFDRARSTQGVGQKNFSDVMVIPASVVRRAVQEGIDGKNSDFFYVRHFTGGSTGDTLGFVNQNGITGSLNAGGDVLTLTGTTTLANYQTALRSIVFYNTSHDPVAGSRNVSFQVNDGASANNFSTVANKTVTLVPTNTPPTAKPAKSAALR